VAQKYIWANYVAPPVSGGGSSGGGGGGGGQIPLPEPQATVARATPYRATTPTVLSLFFSAAVPWAEMRPYLLVGSAVLAGVLGGVGLVL